MPIDEDIIQVARQEERLQFARFDPRDAWTIGERLKAAAEARHADVAIEVGLFARPLFFYAMPGTTPDNADWIRRKRNVVERFHRSSYAVGLRLRQEATTLEAKLGLPTRDYAPHGGCFPITLDGTGCIGTVAVSGLPQRQDHELLVTVLADVLRQPHDELALGPES